MKKLVFLSLTIVLGITIFAAISCNQGSDDPLVPPDKPPTTPIPIPDDGEIPDPPENVVAVAGNSTAAVSWDRVFSAVGYRLYQSEDGVTFIRKTSTVSFTENNALVGNLINGEVYYFGVTAVDERNNESGISYVGGSPTAFPVIPHGPVAPPPPVVPDPAYNVDWVAGDRSLMVTWEEMDPDKVVLYLLKREMNISQYASVPGENPSQKDAVRQSYIDAMREEFEIYPEEEWVHETGSIINGFTIPAIPYKIDLGEIHVGLPPNYLPFGMANGDIWYDYDLYSINGIYTTQALDNLRHLVPNDDPPHAPILQHVFLTANSTGDGLAVLVEWLQPLAPWNSDISHYILTRYELINQQVIGISTFVETPFGFTRTSIKYTDETVMPGVNYAYEIQSVDSYSQKSPASNLIQIVIPGGEEEEEPPTTPP